MCIILDQTPSIFYEEDLQAQMALNIYQEWANDGNFKSTDGGNTTFKIEMKYFDGGTACAGGSLVSDEVIALANAQELRDRIDNVTECDLFLAPQGTVRAPTFAAVTKEFNIPLVGGAFVHRADFNKTETPRFWTPTKDIEELVDPTFELLLSLGARSFVIITPTGHGLHGLNYNSLLQEYIDRNQDSFDSIVNEEIILVGDAEGNVDPDVESLLAQAERLALLDPDVVIYTGEKRYLDTIMPAFHDGFVAPKAFWVVQDTAEENYAVIGLDGFITTAVYNYELPRNGDSRWMGTNDQFLSLFVNSSINTENINPNFVHASSIISAMMYQMAIEEGGCNNYDTDNNGPWYTCISNAMDNLNEETFFGTIGFDADGINQIEASSVVVHKTYVANVANSNEVIYPANFQ
eukprot:Pgem_evm1s205